MIPVNAGHSIRCCGVVVMGSSYTGDESLHGVGGLIWIFCCDLLSKS